MSAAFLTPVKRPHLHLPKLDLRSPALQIGLELAAGGLIMLLLLRWIAA